MGVGIIGQGFVGQALKAGFKKGAECRCDCKGYRPKLRIGNVPGLVALELWISGRSVGIKWTSFAIAA